MITYREFLEDYVEGMDDNLKLEFFHKYCEKYNYEDFLYENDEEFFDIFYSNNNIIELIQNLQYGDYRINDEYVTFDAYRNLKSYATLADALDDLLDKSILIDYLLETEEFLDIYEEETEEFNKWKKI